MVKFLLSFFLFFNISLLAQDLDTKFNKLNRFKLEQNNININSVEDVFFAFQTKYFKQNILDGSLIKLAKKNIKKKSDSILVLLMKGDYELNSKLSNNTLAFSNYNQALEKSIGIENFTLACESLKRINDYYLKYEKDTTSFKYYSDLYVKYANNKSEIAKSYFYKLTYKLQRNRFSNQFKKNQSLRTDFYKGLILSKLSGNQFYLAEFYQLYGVTLDVSYRSLDSSLVYYNNAEKIYSSRKNINLLKNKLFDINVNKAYIYYQKMEYNKSILFLKKADSIKIYNKEIAGKIDVYDLLSKNYYALNDYKNAFIFYQKKDVLDSLLSSDQKNIEINEISTKYQTEKKEKENLQLKQDKERDKYLLIAAILTIIAGSIIYLLSYKNSIRKRKLAEQQKELEKQKNLTLIKEQEITTINAMVDGQEKERKRIAEDLHDNLGSVLATLKLHFENLKINSEKKKINQETLFNKTEGLINEAYLKVRSIAHAKNAGVIANQGLLLAVEMMAEKISSADKIKIEVIHFGLDKRLENTLELTVFRIIQELLTNILKHAEAKKASINISLYDKNLNVIIEDDGKGFDIKKVNLNKGMGISSIKTRVEHLKGTFEIDSTLGKGSSIIMNIPTA